MSTESIRERNDAHIINTYGPRKLALTRGEGAVLWDADGKEYLDFFAGIAVCNLGHAHPDVTQAIQDQAAKLLHCSNLYYIEPQTQLAELLCENSFADKWFFCNSGAEANEAAIKLARRYWAQQGTPKPEIITAQQSFHGRTMATVTATGQPKYHEGFEAMLPGFHYVPYNDIVALKQAITPQVGAILLEPIQGEGGVRIPHNDYLKQVRALCDEHNILLILDEVQTGLGRTGTLFAHTQAGITPDIMTLAKGLANGVPMGAMGCTEKAATGFSVGSHASTFGGNPLSSAAALATLQALLEPGFLEEAQALSNYLVQALEAFVADKDQIVEVRARGLMVGIEFKEPVAPLVGALQESGVICGPAGPNVLRFLPPLIITRQQIDQVMSILATCVGAL